LRRLKLANSDEEEEERGGGGGGEMNHVHPLPRRRHSLSDIHGQLQFVDRKHLHAAMCSTGYGASNVTRKVNRQLSISGIAAPLKNGSVKPS
jgi:hypothetical protein